jgi:hypothetical protein
MKADAHLAAAVAMAERHENKSLRGLFPLSEMHRGV